MRKRNAILFHIKHTFREGMSPFALYEATRGVWEIGDRREEAEYALAVFNREVREIYRIKRWDKAGTHEYKTRPKKDIMMKDRWEFSGPIADDAVRDIYLGYKTEQLGQNPFRYAHLIDSRIKFAKGRY